MLRVGRGSFLMRWGMGCVSSKGRGCSWLGHGLGDVRGMWWELANGNAHDSPSCSAHLQRQSQIHIYPTLPSSRREQLREISEYRTLQTWAADGFWNVSAMACDPASSPDARYTNQFSEQTRTWLTFSCAANQLKIHHPEHA